MLGAVYSLHNLPRPRTSPLGGRPLLGIAERCSLKQQTCTLVSAVQTPYALPHPCVLSGCSCSGNPRVFPYRLPRHITPRTPCISPASQSLPSQGTPGRPGANGNGCQFLPAQPSHSPPGISPTAMEGADSCLRTREHRQLYFHCKLEINHSRKFPCWEHPGYYYFTTL